MVMIISLLLGLVFGLFAFAMITVGKNNKSVFIIGGGAVLAAVSLYFLIPPLISITIYGIVILVVVLAIAFILKLVKKRG